MKTDNLTRNLLYKAIMTFLIIVACILIFEISCGYYISKKYPYVAGKTGKKCYINSIDSYHGNIEYHKYFLTLQDCLDFVEKNK